MVSKDYTQEMGLKPTKQVVPLPIALAILAVAGALIWVTVVKLGRTPASRAATAALPAATQAASH